MQKMEYMIKDGKSYVGLTYIRLKTIESSKSFFRGIHFHKSKTPVFVLILTILRKLKPKKQKTCETNRNLK
jgi:hypothetical protein